MPILFTRLNPRGASLHPLPLNNYKSFPNLETSCPLFNPTWQFLPKFYGWMSSLSHLFQWFFPLISLQGRYKTSRLFFSGSTQDWVTENRVHRQITAIHSAQLILLVFGMPCSLYHSIKFNIGKFFRTVLYFWHFSGTSYILQTFIVAFMIF